MADRNRPEDYYDRAQTGWKKSDPFTDASWSRSKREVSRGPRVDLTPVYDLVFKGIETVAHPIETLRHGTPGQKKSLGLLAATITFAGAGLYSTTDHWQNREGGEVLSEISKNLASDTEVGAAVPGSRASMYAEQLPQYFSADGVEQLRRAASIHSEGESADPVKQTEAGLDDLIAISQLVDGHDLGNGKFMPLDETAQEQLRKLATDYVESGLASKEVKDAVNSGHIDQLLGVFQGLGDDLSAATFALSGKSPIVVSLPPEQPPMTLGG